jgi:hypothetical protein
MQVDDVTEQLKYISLIKQGLDKQNQSLQQEIQHRIIHEKQLETLLLNQHKLEEELKELKNYKEQNMVYNDEIEQYKREVEDKAKEVLSQTVDKVNQVLKVIIFIWNVFDFTTSYSVHVSIVFFEIPWRLSIYFEFSLKYFNSNHYDKYIDISEYGFLLESNFIFNNSCHKTRLLGGRENFVMPKL